MKRIMTSALLLLMALGIHAQELFVGTYNIRQLNRGDEQAGNVWEMRCNVICNQINFESPDAFGIQEAFVGQLHDMQASLDNYAYIGVGRDDGKEEGEYSAIFYKKDRLKLLHSGNFWLSETPDVPCKGWDAACVRICSWGEFCQLNGKLRFFYFNLHMDHVGVQARSESAKLILKKIQQFPEGMPAVLTGDFNVDQTNESYALLDNSGIMRDAYQVAEFRYAMNGTFNDFKTDAKTESRIDHLFLTPNFKVKKYGILTDTYRAEAPEKTTAEQSGNFPKEVKIKRYVARTPSDHFPVMIVVETNK